MNLRERLLLIAGGILATWVIVAVVIVATQRDLLTSQIDEQLRSLPPGALTSLNPPGDPGSGGSDTIAAQTTGAPFSAISVGVIDANGNTTLVFSGQMTDDVPDLVAAVTQVAVPGGITTIGSEEGDTRFRARVVPQPGSGVALVTAYPLTEVDAAIERLERTLTAAGVLMAIVLGLAYLWIQKLGLRPIARVTEVAQAITAGERSRRVPAANPATEAGQLGQAFNVMLDERDASEERLRQFVADASHELRTPLTSVRGYLDLYQQGAFRKPGQLDDVVRRLSAEVQRMQGLVDDLLVLASLEEGRPLHLAPVDLRQLLADAAQDAQVTQPERALTVNVPESTLEVVADEGLLAQLVSILVANALAHTPVTAAVTLCGETRDDGVRLMVADTGPGMDAETASHVFDRFWRGSTSRIRQSHVSGSAGLGLAIARSIVERLGGTIVLDTAPDAGSTFTIDLPNGDPTPAPGEGVISPGFG